MSPPLTIRKLDTSDTRGEAALQRLRQELSPRGEVVSEESRRKTVAVFGEPLTPSQVVERICRDVQARGLAAVIDYTRRIDGKTLRADELRVPEAELQAAHRRADPSFLQAVRRIRENITVFQSAILRRDVRVDRPGGYLLERYRPLRRAGICVPGGAAAYPSTLLMTVVPAQVAGVDEIAVIAPPTDFGAYNADILATCYELGVKEVYRMGGAQGVAALAYGTEICPRVDKIVGPGNLFVALAKRFVFGEVDIDSIAGPSEVVVIADRSADPCFAAFDMLAQAEHSPGASILIAWEDAVLDAILAALNESLGEISRADLARRSLEDYGAAVLVRDEDEACRITDAIAPEHLHIITENAEVLAEKIHNAGAIFLGEYCPVALGDYAAGPSHVLPTSGTARFAGPLSANDFLKPTSILHFDRTGLAELAGLVRVLADKEGLTAHRESVEVRLRHDS
ncbi:MAG: histidinol dehydrogenase [Thermogutta sp.]|nr:histidinol dehydrogenase [Thermogutta sp.]